MFNKLNENEVVYFTNRWRSYSKYNCPGIDERIRSSVEAISKMTGVIPLWSCSGHTLKEQEARFRKIHRLQSRYIVFGIYDDPSAFDDASIIFEQFEKWYRTISYDVFKTFRPRLEATYLANKMEGKGKCISPVWKLSFTYRLSHKEETFGEDPSNLDDVWSELMVAITQFS